MLNISIRSKARKDLKSILNNTRSKWGKVQQGIYKELVQQALHKIAAHPLLGKHLLKPLDRTIAACQNFLHFASVQAKPLRFF